MQVEFPSFLDLSRSTWNHVPTDYVLHGVIIHISEGIDTKGSHYIAYVKEAMNQWWEYDDARRTLVWTINEHGMLAASNHVPWHMIQRQLPAKFQS
jgi:hypothetical protein